ncbi:ShlB/FhaC/HecB family hemolysin secretion/activation protein [Novosphingobium sp. B 225]|uniref:ShlB/FhaC/HecB family hemolysin secretion/activation protein n=1 Tax=Novosphingobium sp. B 225 TaxID=1961849 RepID=UPI0020CD3E85|nr:ShlB/FhaC/HecB family hemolysin secretion/activation protein [Novosphingobium sp. B 225]
MYFRGVIMGKAVQVAQAASIAVAIGLTTPAVLAQSISLPTRDEIERGSVAPQSRDQIGKLTVEGGVERGPCPLADPAYANVRVNFAKVDFGQAPVLPGGILDSAWTSMAGTEQPIAALCEVRDRAATALRQAGYLAAVQIPPQRIEQGGTVRMDVLVARLVDVQVRGDAGHAERLIAAHLKSLIGQQWFNTRQAERHLLLLRDLPGLDVRLVLRPAGGTPGEVVGDVLVKRRPIEVYLSGQNLGSISTGREGLFGQVQFNDVTGLGDRTLISLFNTVQTREQTVLQVGHDMALGANGLRLGGRFVYGRSRPSIASGTFRSKTVMGNLSLSYPFQRRETLTLRGSAGLDLINQSVDFSTTRLNQDKLRVAYSRLELELTDRASIDGSNGYSVAEPRLHLTGGIELRKGTGLFGASAACVPVSRCTPPNLPLSNITADPRAALVRFDGELEFRADPRFSIVIAPRGQYSSQPLLNFEQFSLGNYSIGRGFDPGIVQGDSGIGTAVELRFGHRAPRKLNGFAFQPFAFLDTAWAWTNDGGFTPDPRHVWSAGGGVRARWGDHADVNLTVAAPLGKAGTQTALGDVRVLFTITTRLVPWQTK